MSLSWVWASISAGSSRTAGSRHTPRQGIALLRLSASGPRFHLCWGDRNVRSIWRTLTPQCRVFTRQSGEGLRATSPRTRCRCALKPYAMCSTKTWHSRPDCHHLCVEAVVMRFAEMVWCTHECMREHTHSPAVVEQQMNFLNSVVVLHISNHGAFLYRPHFLKK